MNQNQHLIRLLLLLLLALSCWGVERHEGPLSCPMGREYWLGFPNGHDAARTYWLVVAVHGAGGKGDGMKSFTLTGTQDDYLVVAPSFPLGNPGYYQVLGGGADQQLIGLFKQLQTRFKLRPRLFLYGFSGGAQFAHRFTMAHPDLVIGVSAHSGGTWGPALNPKASTIPLALSCGLDDIKPSTSGDAPRIVEADGYFQQVLKGGYCAKLRYWEGVGHNPAAPIKDLTAECYDLATTGLYPSQRAEADQAFKAIDELLQAGKSAEAKAAIAALPKLVLPALKRKAPARSLLPAAEQSNQRAAFVAAGIGGKSGLNKDFWIDDRNENEAGWNDSRKAMEFRATITRYWLTERAAAYARRLPADGGKTP